MGWTNRLAGSLVIPFWTFFHYKMLGFFLLESNVNRITNFLSTKLPAGQPEAQWTRVLRGIRHHRLLLQRLKSQLHWLLPLTWHHFRCARDVAVKPLGAWHYESIRRHANLAMYRGTDQLTSGHPAMARTSRWPLSALRWSTPKGIPCVNWKETQWNGKACCFRLVSDCKEML